QAILVAAGPGGQPVAIPLAVPLGVARPVTVPDTAALPTPAKKAAAPWWRRRGVAVAAAALLLAAGGVVAASWLLPRPGGEGKVAGGSGEEGGAKPPGDGDSGGRLPEEQPLRPVRQSLLLSPPEIRGGEPVRKDSVVSRPGEIPGVLTWEVIPRANEQAIQGLGNLGREHLVISPAPGGVVYWDYLESTVVGCPVSSRDAHPSRDLQTCAVLDGKTVFLHRKRGDEWVTARTLKGHLEAVGSAVFSPAGDYLATASTSGEVCFWDVEGSQI